MTVGRRKGRAVVFDLDGTLIDSLDDISDSMNRVLTAHHLPVLPATAYKQLVGDGVRLLVSRAFEKAGGILADPEQAVSQYLAAYRERCELPCRFYPGVAEMLDGLQARSVPMAILSNKADYFTRFLAERFFSAWRFAFVGGEMDGVPRKPDPGVPLSFTRQIGLPPRQVLFVGDSPVDIRTARNAGMVPVGVSWGFSTADALLAHGAKIILRTPTELLDWVGPGRPQGIRQD